MPDLSSSQSDRDEDALLTFPVSRFLAQCHEEIRHENSGAAADYIPELALANPAYFGIALATIDGHVHEIGDTQVEFTIQSVSKAFVFALAMEFAGPELVTKTIGVEASGEAFNSIRLQRDNRPFNPMVNAGAIACTGLIQRLDEHGAFERIRQCLSDFAGRELGVDEAVYKSEKATGDRNRAIAWLLRNNNILQSDVEATLAVYFRQCAILVTARDLAVMGATLAANGVNPVTNKRVIEPDTAAKTLSVMVSAGMYDYSGEWNYRVGLPAKSGVGGGIMATLPAQIGLGTFSPPLDDLGNSVRGIKVCERLSSYFGLHLLSRSDDVTNSISADYNARTIRSSRGRNNLEIDILDRFGHTLRVVELCGALNFVACDYVSRKLLERATYELVVLDMRRVSSFSPAAVDLLAKLFGQLAKVGTRVIVSSLKTDSEMGKQLVEICDRETAADPLYFASLDDGVSWAEDQIIFSRGGFDFMKSTIPLEDQAMLRDIGTAHLEAIRAGSKQLKFAPGDRIIKSGDTSDSVFFLLSGMVSVKLASGAQIASLSAGTCFGEFSLIAPNSTRTADIIADVACSCLELSLKSYDELKEKHPMLSEELMRNLALLLTGRLKQSNAKIETLSQG